MFKKIFNNLKKRGIEVDSLQSNLIKEMVETVDQRNNGLNKLNTTKSIKRSFYQKRYLKLIRARFVRV